MSLTGGKKLGPYEILAPLGSGGMGEVYRARDTRLHREVAVKVLPAALSSDPERLKRFEKEARAASSLNHPNIVTIHDIGQADGVAWIAMELVSGQTLREILAEGPPPTRKTLAIAAQVADALARAHAEGIVHRDLKPENVMVTPDGYVKLLDFGLAKLSQPDGAAGTTQGPTVSGGTHPGIVLGTIGYMSPEQAAGRPLDFRSDQFALGSILYELATGKRAFSKETAPETLSAIIREEPEPVGSVNSQAPAPMRWIIERCLAKSPEDRYASTRDLARDLSNLRDRLSEASGAVTAGAVKRRPRSPMWMRVALPVLAAALAASLLLRPARKESSAAGPTRFLVDTFSSASFYARPPVTGLAVSPDGRRIVFSAGSGSKTRLFLRSLDAVEPVALPGTDLAVSPFWSPDGSQIAFFAGGKLQKIALSGGPPQVICESASGGSGTWGPGGVILIGQWEGGQDRAILRVSAEGGTPVAVTKPASGERAHRWPEFLPDGRRFLFLDWAVTREKRVVSVGSLDSGHVQPLFEANSRVEYAPPGFLLFVREATLLARPFDPERLAFGGDAVPVAPSIAYFFQTGTGAFSASARADVLAYQPRPFDSRLVWFDREGRALGSVGSPAMFHLPPRLSPDGRRVAASVREPRTGIRDIWLYDVASGLPTRLTSTGLDTNRPIWSPDGTRLAYAYSTETGPDIFVWDVASGRQELLLSQPGVQVPQDWSPDGTRIAYQDFSPARQPPQRIGMLRLGAKPGAGSLPPGLPYSEYNPSFSPDGRWLALVSEESGETEVYVVAAEGIGDRRRVSTAGGDHPRWRRDGRELYYLDGEGRLIALSVSPGASGIELGSPRVLFSAGASAIDFDVAAAGDRFLFRMGMGSRPQPPIVVTLDWVAGLKR